MKTLEITRAPGLAATFVRALRSSSKRPGALAALPPVTLVMPRAVVDGAHVARYGAICGFKPADGVPLIYPQMLTFPLVTHYISSTDCPWPALGTVHLANAITQHQPLRAGDTVRVELQTGDLFAHEKGQVFDLHLRILRGDDLLWSATQTLLRVGVKPAAGQPYAGQVLVDAPLSCQTEFFAPANLGRRYGAVSGDRNPIHLSALSAKLFGFKRAIAHGMWTQARAAACLMPDHPLSKASLNVEFKTPLFLPAKATLWTCRSGHGAQFEVRDGRGQKPHVRGQLAY